MAAGCASTRLAVAGENDLTREPVTRRRGRDIPRADHLASVPATGQAGQRNTALCNYLAGGRGCWGRGDGDVAQTHCASITVPAPTLAGPSHHNLLKLLPEIGRGR